MPQPFNPAVMTNAGAQLLTRAQAGEITLEFTRMAIGDGAYSTSEKTVSALQARTALKHLRNSYALSGVTRATPTAVRVTALLSNYDSVSQQPLVTSGYNINELGLYARPKGSTAGEVLYSIAVTSGAAGDYMPPYNGYNPAQITQDYYATVDNSGSTTINTSGAAVLVDDFEALGLSVNEDGELCIEYEEE